MRKFEIHELPLNVWIAAKKMINIRNHYYSSGLYSYTIKDLISEMEKAGVMTSEIKTELAAFILSSKEQR